MPQQHNTAESGGVVYAVQNGNQYVYLYRNKPPYWVEPLSAKPPLVPEPLVRRAPSWLLSARHQVVPFYGRDYELARLRDWRDDPTLGVSVRLVHAPGGQGKTRLAAQFAGACTQQGWTVAVARHCSEAAAAGGTDQQLAVYQRGLVLIVDYAERWPLEDVLTLLRQHQTAASTPIRVLLLARPGGGWWQSLAYQLSKANIKDVRQWELTPLAEHPSDQQAIYAAACDRFASVLGLAAPTSAAEPDLGGTEFELVLAVHMKALVDVDAASRGLSPPPERDQAGLSSYLLDREHDYWRAAHHDGTGPIRTNKLGMSRAVYTATLTRALSHSDGVTALTRVKIGEATPVPISEILGDHTVLYPPADPNTVLEPLYPDRLGEDFIALTTPGHTATDHTRIEPWAATLPAQLLNTDNGDDPTPPYARAAITVLIEAAHRWPHLAERQLYPILRQRPHLALTAGGAALIRLAELQHPGILDVLHAIEPHLPGRHLDLAPGIAALTARLTTHRLASTPDPSDHASLYATLGYRLAYAGQWEQALAATTEAVKIYRRLAEVNPVAIGDLSWALRSLAVELSNLGRREEALDASTEVVQIDRLLAAGNPAAFDSSFATAMSNLSVYLSDLGRQEEALDASTEAVEIYCRLAAGNPAAFEHHLAGSLHNLSDGLADLGRREEALPPTMQAVKIYRRLAAGNPAAFEHRFAMALTGLGNRLADLERREEALPPTMQAVEIYRRLAVGNPAAFEPRFAGALDDFGNRLVDSGRLEEALTAHIEAIQIRRRLAAENPAAFEHHLAGSLNNLGHGLANLKRLEEARTAHTEAIQIYRRLAAENPATHDPHLATALNNLNATQIEQGRREEALTTSTEIVQTYRRLAARNPAAYDSELAHALRNFARQRVAEQIALPEALIAAYESVAIYSRLGQRLPEAFTGEVRRALAILTDVQAALTTQQKTTAVDPRTPKVSLLRRWIRRS